MTTPLTTKDSQPRKEDAATQQIAREAWAQLDRATLTHHNLDSDKSEQGIAIILSALERATADLAQELKLTTTQLATERHEAAQPQPSKARKEQAPRAQDSPASGERSEPRKASLDNVWGGDSDWDGITPGPIPPQPTPEFLHKLAERSNAPRGQQQEWTARKAPTGYIAALYSGNTEVYRQPLDCLEDLERVADAHNAELTAAYEKGKQDANEFAQEHCYRPS